VQAVLGAVAGHRLRAATTDSNAVVTPILHHVAIP
jgi:hypothetical protein